jgi:hypothetical protein
MTTISSSSVERRCRPLDQWPHRDQRQWRSALQVGDLLEPGGSRTERSPFSNRAMVKGYGRWLAWLDRRGLLDAQVSPGDRITPDRVRAYVGHLEAENASGTVIARIIELKVTAAIMDPERDWSWIYRFASSMRALDGEARGQPAHSERHAIPVREGCGATPCEIGSLARLLAEGRSVKASNDHVVAGLIEKRRELAGIIDDMQRRLDQYRADLTHIDGALRVLATDLDPETIRPKRLYRRNRYFSRNELSRLCLGVLRTAAGELLSTDEITGRVIAAKGFDAGDAI